MSWDRLVITFLNCAESICLRSRWRIEARCKKLFAWIVFRDYCQRVIFPPTANQSSVEALEPSTHRLLESWSQRYRTALVSYFRKRLRGSAEVEDLVQEVFLRLARQHELSAVRLVEPYLFQTASHVLTDYARTCAVRHVQDHEVYEDEAHSTEVRAPETVLADSQSVDRLLVALAELPERTRTIFMLRRWDELPNADIARMLGVSVSAIEKHITKALIHLRERMRQEP